MSNNPETQNLYQSMLEHLRNRSEQFAWLQNPLPTTDLVPDGEPFLALVIGGSTLQKAIATHTPDGLFLEHQEKEEIPPLDSAEDLFSRIIQYVERDTKVIALNFSFPMTMELREDSLDGVLIRATKAHDLGNLIGKRVGEECEKYIHDRMGVRVTITVSHDATCLMLAGLPEASNPQAVVAGVVGTGTNFAVLEEQRVLNMESGNFHDFEISETTKIIDQKSNNQGQQLFEKSVSGAYLYQHYNLIAKTQGLDPIESSNELSFIASATQNSPEALLARQIIEGSAQMVGAHIAALYTHLGVKTLSVIMEGSLFWHGHTYKETVEQTLQTLGIQGDKIHWISVPKSSLVGTAYLVKKV